MQENRDCWCKREDCPQCQYFEKQPVTSDDVRRALYDNQPKIEEMQRMAERIAEQEARFAKAHEDDRIDTLKAENKRLTLLRDHLQTVLESTELELARAQARLAAQPPQQEGE